MMRSCSLICASLLLVACGGNNRDSSSPSFSQVKEQQLTGTSAGMDFLIGSYLSLKNTLVESDSLAADTAALKMLRIVDSLSHDTLYNAPKVKMSIVSLDTFLQSLLKGSTLQEKRRSFQSVGLVLQRWLSQPGNNARPVYVQTCPMAFDDVEAASWLSDSREIMNPYLGKNHPRYASGMLHCGELTDSLGVSQ